MRGLRTRKAGQQRPSVALDATRPRRGRDERGQSIVEMALILPLITLLVAIAFTGWDALQQSIRLTTAARAGAIKAANDLSVYAVKNNYACSAMIPGGAGWTAVSGTTTKGQPQYDAKEAVNSEEGVSSYQDTSPGADNYVNITGFADTNAGVTIDLVTVTVSHQVAAWLPFVSTQHVNATATARYC